MSKTKRIVLISVLSVVLALVIVLAVLFGAVFVLRSETVSFLTELDKAEIYTKYPECESKILEAANLKLNKSIFNQDKEQAAKNIENEFTYIKVTNISFLNANTIDVQLRARHEMFYYNVSDRYFVLDEDLKVLNVVNTKDELNEGLIKINPVKLSESSNEPVTTNILGADINTKTNNFIGNEYKNIFPNLYKAIYNTVKLDKDGEMAFVDREDIKQLVSEVSFKVGYAYERLVLSVNYPQGEQSYSYTIDIAKPNENLQSKINWCFSSIPELIKHDKHGGTIRCYYDDAGKEICKYFD